MSLQQNVTQMRKLTSKLSTLYAEKVESLILKDNSCSQDVYALTKLIDSFQKLATFEHKNFGDETNIESDSTQEDDEFTKFYIQKILESEVLNITPEGKTYEENSQTTPPSSEANSSSSTLKFNETIPVSANNNTPPKGKFYHPNPQVYAYDYKRK